MPRQARFILANYPHHIIQRGHNRQNVFSGNDDYLYYLDTLATWKTQLGCKVYAYCLMANHVHLVIDPGDTPEHLGLLMKRLAGRQTRYINAIQKRSGSLWEGRYKSSPVQTDPYLQTCCRYVELNPVRTGIVDDPADYLWSSCRAKVRCSKQPWLDLDSFYLSLGKSAAQRAQKYTVWLQEATPETELQLIRTATQRGQLIGHAWLAEELSSKFDYPLVLRGPGRPKKEGQ
ncbi:transposase [Desulfobulbus alkaliphilus]|uniref:transposase n=1 Tax=Desulfobulbus alkaliphilus TaxID=869814 RepID=UPI00196678AE|nr:transposase [Desulfobulbus alkaliphilus]MBM9535719.1 transposase [Desulfobulbus alkaliphilus]